ALHGGLERLGRVLRLAQPGLHEAQFDRGLLLEAAVGMLLENFGERRLGLLELAGARQFLRGLEARLVVGGVLGGLRGLRRGLHGLQRGLSAGARGAEQTGQRRRPHQKLRAAHGPPFYFSSLTLAPEGGSNLKSESGSRPLSLTLWNTSRFKLSCASVTRLASTSPRLPTTKTSLCTEGCGSLG